MYGVLLTCLYTHLRRLQKLHANPGADNGSSGLLVSVFFDTFLTPKSVATVHQLTEFHTSALSPVDAVMADQNSKKLRLAAFIYSGQQTQIWRHRNQYRLINFAENERAMMAHTTGAAPREPKRDRISTFVTFRFHGYRHRNIEVCSYTQPNR